jgi:energy-coupling factor transport system substrate-specific component
LYGAIMNLYFWPYLAGAAAQSWQPGATLAEGLARYAVFYVVQSALPDAARAVGNVVLMLALGGALLRALRRFQGRFAYQVVEIVDGE